MSIFVTHNSVQYGIELKLNDQVKDLILRISEEVGLTTNGFDIYLEGEKLDNPNAVALEVGIEPDSEIEIRVSRAGSAKARLGCCDDQDFRQACSTFQSRLLGETTYERAPSLVSRTGSEAGGPLPYEPVPEPEPEPAIKNSDVDDLIDYIDAEVVTADEFFHSVIPTYLSTEHTSYAPTFAYTLTELAKRGIKAHQLFSPSIPVQHYYSWDVTLRKVRAAIDIFHCQPDELATIYKILELSLSDLGEVALCLLRAGLDPSVVDIPKLIAANTGRNENSLLEICSLVLSRGGDLSNALVAAADSCLLKLCEELLKLGVTEPDSSDARGLSAAFRLAREDIINLFLSYDRASPRSLWACAVACFTTGNVRLLEKVFLFKNFSVTATNNFGESLLHFVCIHGKTNMAERVVEVCRKTLSTQEQHQFINGQNASGEYTSRRRSPLEVAVRHNRTEITKLLIQNGAAVTAASLAHCSSTEMQDILLRSDNTFDLSDVNKPLDTVAFGSTPFLISAKHGFEGIVSHLLKNGADVKVKNDAGCNALFGVAVMNLELLASNPGIDIRLAEMLRDAGLDLCSLGSVNNKPATVLDAALHEDRLRFREYLVKNGVGTIQNDPGSRYLVDKYLVKQLKKNSYKHKKPNLKSVISKIF